MRGLIILGALVTALVCACEADPSNPDASDTEGSDDLCGAEDPDQVRAFDDAKLEMAIRAALGVGTQAALTFCLISGLTELDATAAGITSLVGLENLTSLTELTLWGNSISDISELSGLRTLTSLSLRTNSVSDISALNGLTSLTDLDLSFNPLSDISVVSGLTQLTVLLFTDDSVSDISALVALRRLTSLSLEGNADLGDIQALLDNTGLGVGTTVRLGGTKVSCTAVAGLGAKGVDVRSDCP